MAINFSDLKDNFYDLGLGVLEAGCAVYIGSRLYNNPMKFAANLINEKEFLAALALTIYEIASPMFNQYQENIYRDFAIVGASIITVGTIAYRASLGHIIPSYLLLSISTSLAALFAICAGKDLYKGISGLSYTLFGQKENKNKIVV